MAKGISLHVGVNECSADHYGGWTGPLKACEHDAEVMNGIARSKGFESMLLLTRSATRDNVINGIRIAAKALGPDDKFIVSFAGHGGQVPDTNADEEDQTDETWCLYDGQLIDDELGELWAAFKPGVRILIVADCCHSGTVSRGDADELLAKQKADMKAHGIDGDARPRMMPDDAAFATFRGNTGFYTNVMLNIPNPPSAIHATVQLFSGCQDDQLSYDGEVNGKFTTALKQAWNDGNFGGSYDELYAEILKIMPDWQRPNHLTIGAPNPAFATQKAFVI